MIETKTIQIKQCNRESVALYIKKSLGLKNFKPLGSGSYAVVYGAKNHKKVYKIGRVQDNKRGYLKYITALSKMKKHNRYTPLIYSWWTFTDGRDSDDDVFVVCMERLKELEGDYGYETADLLESLIERGDVLPGAKGLGLKVTVPPALKKVATIIVKLCEDNARADIHSGNIMMRGEQIVITDPVH